MSLRRSSRRSSHLASEALATGIRPSRTRTASIAEDIDTTPARAYRDAAAHSASLDEDVVAYSGTPVRRGRPPGTGKGKGKTPAKSTADGTSTATAKKRGRPRKTVVSDDEEGDQSRRGSVLGDDGRDDANDDEDRETDSEEPIARPVVKKIIEHVRRISRELTPTSTPARRSRRVSRQEDDDEFEENEIEEQTGRKSNPFVRRLREVAEEEESDASEKQNEDEFEDADGQTTVPWRWEYAGEVYDQFRNCAACFWPLAVIVTTLFVLIVIARKDPTILPDFLTTP
ncbi:hypothetical protein HK097_010734 [Rhizophlyctis rosea]|uniref:Transmembrane protein n=1 Tax=Rhizophlyctis rosea TaxID=64517 RepID=A0AAD5X2D1_9FUNG|nr:hypothetical protein HK097_010734 [Rhizophlyctis rosea]